MGKGSRNRQSHQNKVDHAKKNKKKFYAPKWLNSAIAIVIAAAVLIGVLPQRETGEDGESTLKFGLEQSPKVFWVFCGIALGGLLLTYLLYRIYRKKPQ